MCQPPAYEILSMTTPSSFFNPFGLTSVLKYCFAAIKKPPKHCLLIEHSLSGFSKQLYCVVKIYIVK